MAAHYINEMRSVQPEGPYFFGGACFGGLVSFEMAQQLHAIGQKVGLVAMFDTYGPGYPSLRPSTRILRLSSPYGLLRRTEHHLMSLYLLKRDQKSAYIKAKTTKAKKLLRRAFRKRKEEILNKTYHFTKGVSSEAIANTQDSILQAQAAYRPQIYPGKLTIFRASKQPLGIYRDETIGWNGLAAGGTELHEIPGIHGAIVVEPRVNVLAERLKACLAQQQGREEKSGSVASTQSWIDSPRRDNSRTENSIRV